MTDHTPAAQAAKQETVLTDQRINELWIAQRQYHGGEPTRLSHLEFARAIEQELSKLRAPVADERAAQRRAAGNQYHVLKTDPEVFQAVLDGAKTFEIRMNDRGYSVGDALGLRETKHTGAEMRAGAPLVYTGRECQRFVSHVLTGYGLADGWCCLSFDLPHAGGASAPVAGEAQQPYCYVLETRDRDGLLLDVEFNGSDSFSGGRKGGKPLYDHAAPQAIPAGEAQPVAYAVHNIDTKGDVRVAAVKPWAGPESMQDSDRWGDRWAGNRPLVYGDAAPQASEAVRVQQLEAARIAYAREFPPDENGDPDVGNIHANIRKLKSQLAALSAQPGAQKGGSDA